MKQRHTFHVEWVESLETRELLSGAGSRMVAARALAQQRAAHIATARANQQLDRENLIPQGPISVKFATPADDGSVSALPSRVVGNASNLRVTKAPKPVAIVNSSTPGSYSLNTSSGTHSAAIQSSLVSYGRIRPGSYAMSVPVTTSLSRTQTGSTSSLLNAGNLPAAAGPIVSSEKVKAATAVKSDAAGSTSFSIDDATTLPAPVFYGMFDNATLSKADVAKFKGAVDTFAAAFTYGADEAKDKAAGDALRTAFGDLAMSAWSQTHVASTASVSQLDAAVSAFQQSYTNGSDLTKDKAAWKALSEGMTQFTRDLMANSTGTDKGMYAEGAPMLMAPPIGVGAGSIQWAADDLLNGPALTRDDMTQLRKLVDAFAAGYTSGVDSAKDQEVSQTLQKDFSALTQARWERAYPADATGDLGSGIAALSSVASPMARQVTAKAAPVTVANVAATHLPRATVDPIRSMLSLRGQKA